MVESSASGLTLMRREGCRYEREGVLVRETAVVTVSDDRDLFRDSLLSPEPERREVVSSNRSGEAGRLFCCPVSQEVVTKEELKGGVGDGILADMYANIPGDRGTTISS